MRYLGRKTNYIVAPEQTGNLEWLWIRLTRAQDWENLYKTLDSEDLATLEYILLHFGYVRPSEITPAVASFEKKYSWVFQHPNGGIFIPLELFKLFMPFRSFQEKYWLFSLLYRLGLKEQKNFASLIGREFEAQLALSFERNQKDMAMVLYIYLGHQLRFDDLEFRLPTSRGKVLSFRPGMGPESTTEAESISLPDRPVNLREYLEKAFPGEKKEVANLFALLEARPKSFYRALGLACDPDSRLMRAFQTGILIPLISRSIQSVSLDSVRVISSREARFYIENKT